MTTELKTLKDLRRNFPFPTPTRNGMLYGVFLETDLKAEAIKWVKSYGGFSKKPVAWIIHFFNLTEEDFAE
jgi:hypothetical protein